MAVARAPRLPPDSTMGWIAAALFWLVFALNLPDPMATLFSEPPAPKGPFDALVEIGAPIVARTTEAGNDLDRAFKIAMILGGLLFIARRRRLATAVAKFVNPGLALFLVSAIASTLWSIAPSSTILRCITFYSIVLACVSCAIIGWHPRRFQQLALPPLLFIVFASLLLGTILPTHVIEAAEGVSLRDSWHGIVYTKNEFGMESSLCAILCAHRLLARRGFRVLEWLGLIAALACVFLSRSSTSLLATSLALFSMLLLMRSRLVMQRFSVHVVVAITALLVVYELAIQEVIPGIATLTGPIANLVGKDTTFSARTIIWRVIKDHISFSPLLGSGYGAYWTGPVPESPSYIFMSLMWFYPTESHNGYLELLNDLGILGLICVTCFLLWHIRQSLQLMKVDRSQATLFLAVLFQQMVINMSESEWFSRSSTSAILMLSSFALSRAMLEVRRKRERSSPQLPRSLPTVNPRRHSPLRG